MSSAPPTIAVSLLAAPPDVPLLHSAREVARSGCWQHVDVMDGSVTGGSGIDVDLLPQLTALGPVEVHVMAADAIPLLPTVLAARPARVALHVEWTADLGTACEQVSRAGVEPWVAAGPTADPAGTAAARSLAGGLLLVALTPGSRTEPAGSDTRSRLAYFAGAQPLGVDGGVGPDNAAGFHAAGATHLVSGRAVFSGGDVAEGIARFRRSLERAAGRAVS